MKAPPAEVRLLSTPTSILILGPSSAFGMPDLKPVSVLSSYEMGPNDRHAYGVLQSIQSDNYEMTKAQDYLGRSAGETFTISNAALNRDTILGLRSHLQSGRSQMIVVDRYYRHATAFTPYAKSGTGHVPLAHPSQQSARTAARPKLPVLHAAPVTQAIPPQANVGSWSVEQRLKLLFEDMLPLLGQDLRAYIRSMLTGKALASLVAGVVVMAGLQAIPGVGEIADAALLGVVWIYAGWDGLRAVPVLIKAVRHAASATTTGEIEAAAPDAARALETIGGDVLAILIARAAKRNTSGGGEASEAEVAAPANSVRGQPRAKELKPNDLSKPNETVLLPRKLGQTEPGAVPSTPQLEQQMAVARERGMMSAKGFPDLPAEDAQNFNETPTPWNGDDHSGVAYRMIGEGNSPTGTYWQMTPPTDEATWRANSAVQNNWNGDGGYVTTSTKGLKGWQGLASPQLSSDNSNILPGGGQQIWLPYDSASPSPLQPTPWNTGK